MFQTALVDIPATPMFGPAATYGATWFPPCNTVFRIAAGRNWYPWFVFAMAVGAMTNVGTAGSVSVRVYPNSLGTSVMVVTDVNFWQQVCRDLDRGGGGVHRTNRGLYLVVVDVVV